MPALLCIPRTRELLPAGVGHICKIPSLASDILAAQMLASFARDEGSPCVTAISPPLRGNEQVRNFAHFGDGARVLPELTSLTHGTKDNDWLSREPSTHGLFSRTPPYIVSDEVMRVGDCWEFDGSRGILGILLSEPTSIASIRLDNIHPDLVSSASAAKAPRSLRLWGLVEPNMVLPPDSTARPAVQFSVKSAFGSRSLIKSNDRFVLLLDVDYDPRTNLTPQVFSLAHDHWSLDFKFRAVLLEVLENWGGKNTCLYHFTVHQEWI